MRIIKTTIAVLLLGMFATSAYADVILAVDADAGTAGITAQVRRVDTARCRSGFRRNHRTFVTHGLAD